MTIKFHPHALERIKERGTNKDEIISTIKGGEEFSAKFGRTGYRRNFPFKTMWKGKRYNTKQVEAYTVKENKDWIVVTVIVKYF